MYEGALRVPFMMQWKGKIPAGQTYEKPVSSFDIYATAAANSEGVIAKDSSLKKTNLAKCDTAARSHGRSKSPNAVGTHRIGGTELVEMWEKMNGEMVEPLF